MVDAHALSSWNDDEIRTHHKIKRVINSALEDYARLLEIRDEMTDNQCLGHERSEKSPEELYGEAEEITKKYSRDYKKIHDIFEELGVLAR